MSQHRIFISRKVDELIELAESIFKRHTELGKNSPLNALDWSTQGTKVSQAMAAHKRAEELRRQYSIGYYPEINGERGERRQIRVRVARPNVVVRAKSSYIVGQGANSVAGN